MTLTHISQIISDREQAKILAACKGIDAEAAEDLLQWAETTRLANRCLDLAIAGELQISLIDGEPCFDVVK